MKWMHPQSQLSLHPTVFLGRWNGSHPRWNIWNCEILDVVTAQVMRWLGVRDVGRARKTRVRIATAICIVIAWFRYDALILKFNIKRYTIINLNVYRELVENYKYQNFIKYSTYQLKECISFLAIALKKQIVNVQLLNSLEEYIVFI